mgnify:CR=1 FL=1
MVELMVVVEDELDVARWLVSSLLNSIISFITRDAERSIYLFFISRVNDIAKRCEKQRWQLREST